MGDGSKDIAGVGRGSFDAIAVIYTSLAGFGVNIKILEIVIEVDRAGTQVSSEQGCMGGEDCSDIYPSFLSQGESHPFQQFVKMSYDVSFSFVRHIL